MAVEWRELPTWLNVTERVRWLKRLANEHGKAIKHATYTNLTAEKIAKLNEQFLQHSYPTDVITFCYSERKEKGISYEAYISVDVIIENARSCGGLVEDELDRVIAHALLHCLGYDDKEGHERKIMRRMEEKFLVNRNKVSRGT